MTDAWFETYAAGDFQSDSATTAVTASVGQCPTVGAADPRLVLGAVLDVLAARRVPVVIDRLDRALEDIGRLLRDLGIEATDAWTAAPWTE